MCGIAVIVGPGASGRADVFEKMKDAIAPRGEAMEVSQTDLHMLATSRLKIVDRDHAQQPWFSTDERFVLSYNGEIFNHADLRAELEAQGHHCRSVSDTEVVLETILAWGEPALLKMRGQYAFTILDQENERVFIARDPAGVNPLYWAHDGSRLFVASEVKALVPTGLKIHEVPPGHCGWAEPGQVPELHPYIDLLRLGEGEPMIEDLDEAKALVRSTYERAVAIRVDTDLTVGVILSGGLDSSLALVHVARMHPDCVAFTIGTPGSPDIEYARRLTSDLGVRHVVIDVAPKDLNLDRVKQAIRVSECTEYGDVINAVATQILFERIHADGVKVVLTGDGSDELFGGYDMYAKVSEADRRRLFLHKIRHLSRTELQRVDRASMSNNVEARVPYLDLDMLLLSMRIPLEYKVRDGYEKWILRQTFADVLPDYILARHKNPMSHSSGVHERARLYKPMFSRIYRSYGYEALGPMRRDFSSVLRTHDYDLEKAVAAAETAGDYSAGEKARDWVGAVRWNVQGALRKK